MDNYEDNINNGTEELAQRPDHRIHGRKKDRDKYFVLRNWLNSIFILCAIVGMCIYFFGNRDVGTYVVLGSIVLKFVECIFRVMK
ncbi:MAG: hypothetical protein SOZ80_00880 [Prevotella sp.]|uniref:hypothetical protein n=1 Tax=Prevotella sp. TaxID=59823 RepID=UPI002A281EC0|nr:hypothetical protein [Prevotella sp.]MDD7318722.1 hypothetical protein [Prevotellaceae bacterium]MDY4019321.1 hypothetical protein [Prevotella sp.]